MAAMLLSGPCTDVTVGYLFSALCAGTTVLEITTITTHLHHRTEVETVGCLTLILRPSSAIMVQGPIVAFCDHAPFFEGALREAMASIGVGLKPLPGGVRDTGVKMDVAHLLLMRLGYTGINQANGNAGMPAACVCRPRLSTIVLQPSDAASLLGFGCMACRCRDGNLVVVVAGTVVLCVTAWLGCTPATLLCMWYLWQL
jgi:hypothetical protein